MPFEDSAWFPRLVKVRSAIVGMQARASVAGIVFYLSLSPMRSENLKASAIGLIVLTIWSYYDGWFALRRLPHALFEGVLLYVTSACVARFLLVAIGPL